MICKNIYIINHETEIKKLLNIKHIILFEGQYNLLCMFISFLLGVGVINNFSNTFNAFVRLVNIKEKYVHNLYEQISYEKIEKIIRKIINTKKFSDLYSMIDNNNENYMIENPSE